MIPDNLKAITDEELLALSQESDSSGQKSKLTRRESERVWNEIVRRRELKNDPFFGRRRSEPVSTKSIFEEKAKQFDPKHDISADARYLWKRIFVWFWLVPFVCGLLLWLLHVVLK
jgi:hypothetical protein